jgi:hypothetical protein
VEEQGRLAMHVRSAVALCAIVVLSCFGAAGTEAASQAAANSAWLTGSQIRALVTGKKIELIRPDGWKGLLVFHPDGKIDGYGKYTGASNGFQRTWSSHDTGTWLIKGNQYCVTWTSWNNGNQICIWIRHAGPAKYISRDDHGYEKQLSVQ